MTGKQWNRLYEMNCEPDPTYRGKTDIALIAHVKLSIDIWHRRMAHLNPQVVYYLAKYGMVTGLEIQPNGELGPCNGCAEGKHPQAPFPKKGSRAGEPLERLHMDLQGPFSQSLSDFRCSLAIVDCCTRLGWKIYLKAKDEATDNIKSFVTETETQTGRKVKQMRCDGGGEFVNNELKAFAKLKGIVMQKSTPYTPQQNGVAERFNRTTHEHALAMLKEAKLSDGFWPEAHEYANH